MSKENKITNEEINKRIKTMIKYMEKKWENGSVELMNDFEYVNHPGGMDFMSNVREYLLIVENMIRNLKEEDIEIKGEKFVEEGLPGFKYYTENALVKYAYSIDEKSPLAENESYYIKIEWIKLDYKLDGK